MTNAERAIMSLVAEQPRHGYDIEKIIESRGMRDWTEIGFSSIYYVLNKLEKAGMIESQLQQPAGKGPARKVYSITQQGWQAHVDETIAALSAPQSGSSSFLLGLSNIPVIPKEQLIGALNMYVANLEGNIERMMERAEDQRPLPPHVEAVFDYGRVLAEAELNWIRNFIGEIEVGNVEN